MSYENTIPQIKSAEPFRPESPDEITMSNGMTMFAFKKGEQEIIKLDLVFDAGTVHQPLPLVSLLTGKLLKEGSSQFNSETIAYQLDFHGAYLEFTNGYHRSTISLYCLTKHLAKLIPLLTSIIKEPQFPEKEFSVAIENRKQEFLINSEKVKVLAAKKFNSVLWGDKHPYAAHAQLADFDKVSASHLRAFHKAHYHPGDCTLFVAGMVTPDVIAIIDKYLCVGWTGHNHKLNQEFTINPSEEKFHFIEKAGVQSAIKYGRHIMDKNDADFPAFQVLNTVLGGYFGSRLMRNIRENKGYTYGIGSSIVSQPAGSYLNIATQTANENVDKVIDEINYELNVLRSNPIPNDELQMVKNYLGGELMRSFDGPFAILDIYFSLWEHQLDFDYIKYYLECIDKTTPSKLMELANNWLKTDDFFVVVAGDKK